MDFIKKIIKNLLNKEIKEEVNNEQFHSPVKSYLLNDSSEELCSKENDKKNNTDFNINIQILK